MLIASLLLPCCVFCDEEREDGKSACLFFRTRQSKTKIGSSYVALFSPISAKAE